VTCSTTRISIGVRTDKNNHRKGREMNSRWAQLGFALIGAIGGAVVTYLIMDRLHAEEINELYSEMDDMQQAMNQAGIAIAVATEVIESELADAESDEGTDESSIMLHIVKDYEPEGGVLGEEDEDPRPEIIPDEFEPIHSDEEAVVEEDEDVKNAATFDGIFIIDNSEVSGRMVVGTYSHEDGSFEVNKSMSVGDAGQFDDVIDNEQLYSLIDEKAYGILMEADELDDKDEVRILSVRNNILNLDFVVRY
jgi:hypothetical protein